MTHDQLLERCRDLARNFTILTPTIGAYGANRPACDIEISITRSDPLPNSFIVMQKRRTVVNEKRDYRVYDPEAL